MQLMCAIWYRVKYHSPNVNFVNMLLPRHLPQSYFGSAGSAIPAVQSPAHTRSGGGHKHPQHAGAPQDRGRRSRARRPPPGDTPNTGAWQSLNDVLYSLCNPDLRSLLSHQIMKANLTVYLLLCQRMLPNFMTLVFIFLFLWTVKPRQ